jgi:hypothetical protein
MIRSYCAPCLILLLIAGCGGSTRPASEPTAIAPAPSPDDTASEAKAPDPDAPSESTDAPREETKKEVVPEPNFTADMTVEQAIKAIPPEAERMNVDQETLSKPLEQESLYEPCKPGTTHFKLQVAVWRGKAVAIDLSTTPKNPKLAECLKGRLRELTWPAKVPSLNTVEYSM